jgi:hypothetical protein
MTCRLCNDTHDGGTVNAGGDVGVVHRWCFAVYDRRAEAAESLAWCAPGCELRDPFAPALAFERKVEDLTGRRFGHLEVLHVQLRERYGRTRREWRCRCDCGEQLLVTGHRLRVRRVSSCAACARAALAGARRDPLVARLAAATGLTVDAIRSRRRKGVALEAPRQREPRRRRAAA